jgi:type VI secretion system protein ImpJ
MFLRPHHFQAAQRHQQHFISRGEKWDLHYNWGLRQVDLDLDALANYRLVVRSLRARFCDGTLVAIPEDNVLPALDLKPAFEQSSNVTVYLAVPLLQLGRANVADNARYKIDSQPLEDENTGVNPQPIQMRMLNLKLLLSGQDLTGYEALPIAKLEKSSRAEATPQLAVAYIPPVLTCDAWAPLRSLLETIYDRIGKKVELLANQIVSSGISFDSRDQGDTQIMAELRVLNETYSYLGILTFAQGIHPLHAYLELARLVGSLSIFGPDRRPSDLPKYDHDDLGLCFYTAKKYIDGLLDHLVEPAYKERPFIGTGLRMQVALEPVWLESAWQMFVGVQSPLDGEECIRLLTRAGQLDMKISSSDRVDAVYRLGQAGLRFTPTMRPPRALPSHSGLIYFQISKESQQAEWQQVQKSFTLAIRLNENLIAGDIQGQRVLTIKTGGQTTTLQFTLYVVPQDNK